MSLDVWDAPSRLYLARGDEVSSRRPLFTGDVCEDIEVPGVQESGTAIIIAHPCSMRRGAALAERVLVAAVRPHEDVPPQKWTDGYYDRMPLPELRGEGSGFEVGLLSEVGLSRTDDLAASPRVACLSPVGVNILQQRTVFNLTRLEVPTAHFWDAFAHTYEEADLLEEWTGDLATATPADTCAADFEEWLGDSFRRQRLRDPQQRAPVRAEMRVEVAKRRPSS